jgi:ABC-2 type transport system ATP-binding protein
MTELAIDLQGLTKTFGNRTVVNGISLQVARGAVFGFLGSNGSGKTTTIRMVCGLLTPSAGNGTCLGFDILTQSAEIKQRIGYMPQKFCLYDQLTVYENLRFIGAVYRLPDLASAIDRQLDYLQLGPYRKHRAIELSGGWRQRLSLACCLIHQPELLFLDEPTAGVDPKARKEFWDYLHEIALHQGATFLVTTHYMDEAEKCTNLGYINQGNLLYTGTTAGIIPFSGIRSYVTHGDRQAQGALSAELAHRYPALMTSFVNNELRVSSRDEDLLDHVVADFPAAGFTPAEPTFEEVFIGLIA